MTGEAEPRDTDPAPITIRSATAARHSARTRAKPGTATAHAAIDLGTNNCRMLIARPGPDGELDVLDSYSRITRLGEGLIGANRLSEDAMTRTLDALGRCAGKAARWGCLNRTRAVATEACRRAQNAAAFLEKVKAETGLAIEVISAEDEARLGLRGCMALLDEGLPFGLVFDIGGGSTEVSFVAADGQGGYAPRGMISLPLGVVTVSEACCGIDLSPQACAQLMARVNNLLAPFDARYDISTHLSAGRVQMLGTAGTVTTLGALYLDLPRYDRTRIDGLKLGFDEMAAVRDRLFAMSPAERMAHPCIGPQRADLVISGAAILDAICSFWPAGRITIADRGLREGLLLQMMSGTG